MTLACFSVCGWWTTRCFVLHQRVMLCFVLHQRVMLCFVLHQRVMLCFVLHQRVMSWKSCYACWYFALVVWYLWCIQMDSLIISSLNCQGLGNLQKQRDVFHYLKQKGHSIYCLQDTHFDKKIEKYVTSEWSRRYKKKKRASYKSN